ncbi:MAG: NADH-quinone oxidoreductase subunit C [Clostridiaceae bacterium]
MQKVPITYISTEELIPLAEKMFEEKRRLVIMNGYVDKEGNYCVVYNFDIDGKLETYIVKGYKTVPSITYIYKGSAQWCEEEICEMMPIQFDGLEKSGRLFLPDDFDGTGQILVMPLDELRKKDNKEE